MRQTAGMQFCQAKIFPFLLNYTLNAFPLPALYVDQRLFNLLQLRFP
jgi:hypothetical protein